MEKYHGKYIVCAAVFCLVSTFTSAAVLGEDCTGEGVGDCTGTGVICNEQCVCEGSYKPNTGNTMCIRKGLNDPCSDTADCVAVTGATCNTNCVCEGSYKDDPDDNTKCKLKVLGDTCTDHPDCKAVSNTECTGETDSKVCTCKANYKDENGLCSTANGLQTLLSAPVALLLSFLTIVVIRLH